MLSRRAMSLVSPAPTPGPSGRAISRSGPEAPNAPQLAFAALPGHPAGSVGLIWPSSSPARCPGLEMKSMGLAGVCRLPGLLGPSGRRGAKVDWVPRGRHGSMGAAASQVAGAKRVRRGVRPQWTRANSQTLSTCRLEPHGRLGPQHVHEELPRTRHRRHRPISDPNGLPAPPPRGIIRSCDKFNSLRPILNLEDCR